MTKRKPFVLVKSIDLEFNYVLTIDPEIEPWRAFAATWFDKQLGGRHGKRAALHKFLCLYLPQLGPAKLPQTFFLRSTKLPEMINVNYYSRSTTIIIPVYVASLENLTKMVLERQRKQKEPVGRLAFPLPRKHFTHATA